MIQRRRTRVVRVGNVLLGAPHPVAIQSMLKVPARRIEAACSQIERLKAAGCEIVRLAVENKDDAGAIAEIKRRGRLPLVADIHFDYRLALASIEAGADKIRLNPGNIHKPSEVRDVIAAARQAHIPIRIGANSGSLKIKAKDAVSALVASVKGYLKIFKKARFRDIVISLKGSDVLDTIAAYEKMAAVCDYPLHLGVTATGLPRDGIIKSSVGMGVLLFKGLGDTIRMSLLDEPEEEVFAAQALLGALGLRKFGPEMICCPTCGRCAVNLSGKAREFEERLRRLTPAEREGLKDCKIALMGCVVNGPGEARGATAGIAFSKQRGMLFSKGSAVRSVAFDEGPEALLRMLTAGIKKERCA